MLLTKENLLNLYLLKSLGLGRDELTLSSLFQEQKEAFFLLDAHAEVVMGGWDIVMRVEAMRNFYMSQADADPMEFADAHIRNTPNLELPEKIVLANQKKAETLSTVRKFLEEHGENIAILDSVVARMREKRNARPD